MLKVLVTGGAGFIGGHLVDRLVAVGYDVWVVDDFSTGQYYNSKANYHRADILNPFYGLPANLDGIDCIFHLAAVSRTPPAVSDPLRCTEVNVMGTARVLEYARAKKVRRFVNVSSNVVYAGPTAYRSSKLSAEMLAQVYAQLYGLSAVSLRFSNVYGARIPVGDPAVFSMLRDSYNSIGRVKVTGDGSQTRDWTHVSDIVSGLLSAASTAKVHAGEAVDLCTGTLYTLNHAISLMGKSRGIEIPIDYIPDRVGDVKSIVQDAEVARKMFGWEAKVALEDGIQDIW